jgi:hypothetical protein
MTATLAASFCTPQPPAFANPAQERQHRKEKLAASFRLFSRFGFDEGVAGHITARDPELTDHFWVNPYGQHFGQVRVSDLILVNHRGEVVEGDAAVNRAAFAIHSQVHAARPDVVAAAHVALFVRRMEPLTVHRARSLVGRDDRESSSPCPANLFSASPSASFRVHQTDTSRAKPQSQCQVY